MTEPSASNFPTSLDNTTSLGGDAINLTQLTLDAGIDASTTTVSVAEDISAIAVPCYILADSELIYATATGSGNFTNCDRGAGGTSAASHTNGTTVYIVYAANLFNQLKRAIIATQTALGISSASVIQAGELDFPTSTELTISSGSITPTQNWHTVDTESDAASDDLDTIVASGVTDGYILFLRANNTARTVVIKHNTGNIQTSTGVSVSLDETYKFCVLVYDATLTKWICHVPSTSTKVAVSALVQSGTISTGDGKIYILMPAKTDGMNLIGGHISVITTSSSGTPTVQIARGRQANATSAHTFNDMLSTRFTIDANEYSSLNATTAAVIDGTYDDIATGDLIRVDIDVTGTGTANLYIYLEFQLP